MYNGTYCRLLDAVGENEKEEKFVDGNNQYYTSKERYYGLPGSPIAYWISASVLAVYKKGIALGNIAAPRKGNSTSDNNRFLRFWPEVEKAKMNLHAKIIEREDSMRRRWYPYNKGGGYRKWYGFNENQRIIAGNAQFTGIAAGRGVGFTTGLLLLREGLGMRETPIRPHSWH